MFTYTSLAFLCHLKIAFVILETSLFAGQTHDILEIIQALHRHYPNWKFVLFAHKFKDHSVIPSFVETFQIKYKYAVVLDGSFITKLKTFDVLYVKGAYNYVISARMAQKPTILAVHQIDEPNKGQRMLTRIRLKIVSLITPWVLKCVNKLVTVTPELAEFYNREYGVNCYVIPPIIHPDFYADKISRDLPNKQDVRLISLGNWDGFSGRKQQHVLLQLIKILPKEFLNLKLTLVGLSDAQILELGRLVIEYDIQDRVVLKGFLERKEIIQEFASNHIYVTHTTFEGFYRQILEAFATGLPALVYDSRSTVNDISSAASVNHVVHSSGGVLFTDVSDFFTKLNKILTNYSYYVEKALHYSKKFEESQITILNYQLITSLKSVNLSLPLNNTTFL